MRGAGAAALGAVLAVGCGGHAKTASVENHRIVLDSSIGGVALHERRSRVERDIGRGVAVAPGTANAHRSYGRGALEIWYAGNPPRVLALKTASASFKTAGGIGVGSTYARVSAIPGIKCDAGSTCQHGFDRFNEPGTGFTFDARRERVASIGIGYGH